MIEALDPDEAALRHADRAGRLFDLGVGMGAVLEWCGCDSLQ
jgi:hypothetical protein